MAREFAERLATEANQVPVRLLEEIEEVACNPLKSRLSYAAAFALPTVLFDSSRFGNVAHEWRSASESAHWQSEHIIRLSSTD